MPLTNFAEQIPLAAANTVAINRRLCGTGQMFHRGNHCVFPAGIKLCSAALRLLSASMRKFADTTTYHWPRRRFGFRCSRGPAGQA